DGYHLPSESAVVTHTVTQLAPAPALTDVQAPFGSNSGGATVVLTGTHFLGATGVMFGATPATSFTVLSDTQIEAVAPPLSTGAHDVYVTTPSGTSPVTLAGRFAAVPPQIRTDSGF